jgi:serine/threonine-protein kinase RsbW
VISSAHAVDELDAVYPAVPALVGQIRREVARVATGCGVGAQTVARIELAVSEAVTNGVIHAYRDGLPAGDLHVRVGHDEECLDIRIRDNGVGMSPRTDSPGLGLGLSLMAHLADRIEIKAPDEGGTEILMRFEIAA